MPTLTYIGELLTEVDLLDFIPPNEGEINQYYGKIGSGKTYTATADAIRDLNAGQIVYCNWNIKWNGYDQRDNIWFLLLGILGMRKHFFVFPKSNLKYLRIDDHFTELLGSLTDCIVYLDEGHLYFDSYLTTKMNIKDRANVLHTRHFNRTINIISQRASAIHVTLRANVNRYFKIERCFKFISKIFRITIFKKSEFQELDKDEKPDELKKPEFTEYYFGKNSIFNAYSTKYLRGDTPNSQRNLGLVYKVNKKDCWKKLKSMLTKSKH